MISRLQKEPKVVGVKQSRRAILEGKAIQVFLAQDADPKITEPLEEICAEHKVPVQMVSSMKSLGEACRISVGAAVAALVKA